MPIGSVVILTGIVLAFALFAGVLMWSDLQTGRLQK